MAVINQYLWLEIQSNQAITFKTISYIQEHDIELNLWLIQNAVIPFSLTKNSYKYTCTHL